MKPFETLAESTTPEGQRLTLHRRDGGYFIYLEGEELMATRSPGSELALGELGCMELAPKNPRVLIGGLGLGFTLKAALDTLPAGAKVVVAELLGAVIEWNRTHLAQLQGPALTDRRVEIRESDVGRQIVEGGPWDAVLMDVDNGPAAWCMEANGRFYDSGGIEQIRRSLAAGGRLAVWSAFPDAGFLRRLEKAGFSAKAHTIRSRGAKGHRHTVFVARL